MLSFVGIAARYIWVITAVECKNANISDTRNKNSGYRDEIKNFNVDQRRFGITGSFIEGVFDNGLWETRIPLNHRNLNEI